jgi:hypothetical protein
MSEDKNTDWGVKALKHPLWGLVIAALVGAVAAKVFDSMMTPFTACWNQGFPADIPCALLTYVSFLGQVTVYAFILSAPVAGFMALLYSIRAKRHGAVRP